MRCYYQAGEGIDPALKDNLVVSFRKGGERFLPPGSLHHHPVKKCMQMWDIPPWLRDQIPLLFHGEQLISILGYGTTDDIKVDPDNLGLMIMHEPCPHESLSDSELPTRPDLEGLL